MKFNNTQNEFVTKKNIGDRGIFISRSCAVVTAVLVYHTPTDKLYVLMGERGKGTPDFQGYWNMPCGYLDWDETGTEGACREVWEETGLDLQKLMKSEKLTFNHMDQPWYVNHDSINSNRQNVTLRFGARITTKNDLPKLTNENCEPDEVGELRWVDVYDVIGRSSQYKCAFGHDKVLEDFMTKTKFIK